MNWLFKQDLISNNSKIFFSQKRSFTGKKNEKIISVSNINGKWFFEKLYFINNIEIKTFENENTITIELKEIEDFKLEKSLDDYLFSIRRITNFKKPYLHFRRKYNKLEDIELKAIVNDEIYLERTYFGIIINSLPLEHIKSFLQYISNNNIGLIINNPDSAEAFKLLKEYLEFFILNPSKILVETGNIMKELIEDKFVSEIGFSDESGSKNLIFPQINLINEILQEYESLLKDINSDIEKNSRSFKKYFNKSKLPIQI